MRVGAASLAMSEFSGRAEVSDMAVEGKEDARSRDNYTPVASSHLYLTSTTIMAEHDKQLERPSSPCFKSTHEDSESQAIPPYVHFNTGCAALSNLV